MNEEYVLHCPVCGSTTIEHLTQYAVGENKYSCYVCGDRFETITEDDLRPLPALKVGEVKLVILFGSLQEILSLPLSSLRFSEVRAETTQRRVSLYPGGEIIDELLVSWSNHPFVIFIHAHDGTTKRLENCRVVNQSGEVWGDEV